MASLEPVAATVSPGTTESKKKESKSRTIPVTSSNDTKASKAKPEINAKPKHDPAPTGTGHLERARGDIDVPDHLRTDTHKAPVTLQRRINPYYLDGMDRPHVPRALVAIDKDHPHGTPGYDHENLTVLQQHVAFFDRNYKGIIYPWDTYSGFRAIGYNMLISLWAACVINGFMSYSTLDSWIPSPWFPIYIRNIHRAKHGSDTDVYDTEGRFLPAKFEDIFEKFARTRRDRLTFGELIDMTESMRDTFDPLGWIAAKLEWGFTYWSIKDEEGFVPKEGIRGVYDGSIFNFLERQNQAKKQKPKHK